MVAMKVDANRIAGLSSEAIGELLKGNTKPAKEELRKVGDGFEKVAPKNVASPQKFRSSGLLAPNAAAVMAAGFVEDRCKAAADLVERMFCGDSATRSKACEVLAKVLKEPCDTYRS